MCVTNIFTVHVVTFLTRVPMTEDTFDPAERPPLTPIAFDILLSLMEEEAHGYAIMQSVEERSAGATSLHAGTLYRALSRLVDGGLIEELPEPPEAGADGRRKYYRITGRGRRAAAAEARRLESQLGAARAHGLLGPA